MIRIISEINYIIMIRTKTDITSIITTIMSVIFRCYDYSDYNIRVYEYSHYDIWMCLIITTRISVFYEYSE